MSTDSKNVQLASQTLTELETVYLKFAAQPNVNPVEFRARVVDTNRLKARILNIIREVEQQA